MTWFDVCKYDAKVIGVINQYSASFNKKMSGSFDGFYFP